MDITRDLFPTDSRSPYLTLSLTSRDIEAHNLLTGLDVAGRERIAEALNAAGVVILEVLRAAYAGGTAPVERTSFGCGT